MLQWVMLGLGVSMLSVVFMSLADGLGRGEIDVKGAQSGLRPSAVSLIPASSPGGAVAASG